MVYWKKRSAGMVRATPASNTPTTACIHTIQRRLVPSRSTIGLHSGLITQGRYSQLVYRAMSVLEMPRRLYMMTETVMTIT